jgi:hypothetical protein
MTDLLIAITLALSIVANVRLFRIENNFRTLLESHLELTRSTENAISMILSDRIIKGG